MKKFLLFVFAFLGMILMITGCFEFDEVDSIEFANVPQSTYILNSNEEAAANDVTVTIKSDNVNGTYTLTDNEYITTNGFDFSTTGKKTLTVQFKSAVITFQYKVVHTAGDLFAPLSGDGSSEDEAILIEEPEHFLNIGFKVTGVVMPLQTDSEEEWKAYWQQVFPFLTTGKYFKIVDNIDFTDITFKILGHVGGANYVPFTGDLNGNGKTLSNITINELGFTENTAIFAGINKAKIYDLNIANANVTSERGEKAAILWSGHGVGTAENISEVENITVSGRVIGNRVAGIGAEGGNVIFRNCINEADVYGHGPNSGGIAGLVTQRHYAYKYNDVNGKNEGALLTDYDHINVDGKDYRGAMYNCQNKGHVISLYGGHLGCLNNTYLSGCGNSSADNPDGVYIGFQANTQFDVPGYVAQPISPEWQTAGRQFVNLTAPLDNHRLIDFTERTDRDYMYLYYSGNHVCQSTTLTLEVEDQLQFTYSKIVPQYCLDGGNEVQIDYTSQTGVKPFDNRWHVFYGNGEIKSTNYSYLSGTAQLSMSILVVETDKTTGEITNWILGSYKFVPLIDPRLLQ